ncbi:MAG: ATP-binding protein [Acidobacteria bacterium]|nr:ATP-binding protein [Acidobacteriota bacterium]
MSLRGRIFAVIGLMVVAAFLQAGAVMWFEASRNSSDRTILRAGQRFDHQSRMNRVVVELENEQRSYLLTGLPAFRANFDRRWSEYVNLPTLLLALVDEEKDKRSLADLDRQLQQWYRMVTDLMDRRDRLTDLPEVLRDQTAPPIRQILNSLDAHQRHDFVFLSDQIRNASQSSFDNALFTLALPAVDIIMLLVLVAVLARILLDPLAAMAESARQISGGNFDVRLPPPAKRDEIGTLVGAFRDMSAAVQRRQHDLTNALTREREISQMYAALRVNAEQESARLQATIATVPAALVILEAPGGRVVLQNAAADMLIGREPDTEHDRQLYWESFHATYRDGGACPVDEWGPRRALRGDVVVGQELIVKPQDGRVVPMLVSAAPLRNDLGVITGAVAAFQDITSLYEVDRLKNEFVSVVSHELRTPLTSIKGSLQLLRSDVPGLDPDHLILMDVALANTDRLVRIINDILDISKIEAGKLELNPRPYDARELVTHSIESVGQIARGSSVTLTPIIPPDLPKVNADPDRTIQAIVNLLSNALKYAPARSEVTLEVRPDPPGFVTFAITDRGRGIAADKLGQLFQKFQQIDGANTRRFHGTGLGLAITKALVEIQGGSVGVTSETGVGSTFWITIPVARPTMGKTLPE